MARRSPWEVPDGLRDLALRQGGCITVGQARGFGVTPKSLLRRVDAGRSQRHRGCIVLDPAQSIDEQLRDAWAITLRMAPVAVAISGSMALHLRGHRLPRGVSPVLAVRPARPTRHRLPGIAVIKPNHIPCMEPSRLRGLLVHRPAQAMLDILTLVDPDLARHWIDWARFKRILAIDDLRRAVSAHWRAAPCQGSDGLPPVRAGTKGARARTRLRMALDHALGGTRSEAERVVRRILRQHRLRGFSFDHPVSVTPDAPPIARLDVAFPAALVAIEIDRYEFHSTRAAFERDRDRQNQLAALGWVTLRFTWTMLVKRPDDVAARIRAVLSARSVPGTACRGGFPGTTP